MKPNDIILNNKAQALLKDKPKFMLLSGPTGTGKTFLGGLHTFFRIMTAPANRSVFAIVAESQGTAEKMFVDDAASFVNIFPNCRYVSGKKPHIRVQTVTGLKRIYLGGYSTKRDWTKILGLNLDGIHIEEMSIADDDFIREAFVRASRLSHGWLTGTTNGGLPEQIFYTEFFNKGWFDEKLNPNIPQEEREAMLDIDRRFKYWYWGFDDSATLEQQQIADLYNLFPVGSFFFNSKILGIRGYSEGLLYAKILNTKHVIKFEDINLSSLIELDIGVDLGNSAKTVFTLTGVTHKFQRAVVVDTLEIDMKDDTDYTAIINEFNIWLVNWYKIFYNSIKQVRVDRSEQLFIKQLRNNIAIPTIHVIQSDSEKIIQRVSDKQQLLMQYRLLFSTLGGLETMRQLKIVKDDGKGGHIDNNTPEIDYSDSLDYSMERFVNRMALYRFRT